MSASQIDVVDQTRESILQTLVALARSYRALPEDDMQDHAFVYDLAARRLNDKWALHESIDFIEV